MVVWIYLCGFLFISSVSIQIVYHCVYWPAPSSIQRGLEWSQCLKRLSVLCLIVSKFSHFSLFHPSLIIQYSTEECSTVQLLASSLGIQRGLEWTHLLKRLFDCSMVSSNFLIFPSFILLFLYSTVQKSAVQYSIRPNLEVIYKIIAVIIYIYTSCEWIAMYGPVQYSTVQYSTV